jgi:hypothetical protein
MKAEYLRVFYTLCCKFWKRDYCVSGFFKYDVLIDLATPIEIDMLTEIDCSKVTVHLVV